MTLITDALREVPLFSGMTERSIEAIRALTIQHREIAALMERFASVRLEVLLALTQGLRAHADSTA